MRTAALALGLGTALLGANLDAQSSVKITFTFDADPRPATTAPAEVGNVLALRSALRAWTDSVDVYLDQVALAVRDKGWVRAHAQEAANYLVTITALPVLATQQARGMVVYSVVIFQPGARGQWAYVQNYVGYSQGAQQAAEGVFRAATDAINAQRGR